MTITQSDLDKAYNFKPVRTYRIAFEAKHKGAIGKSERFVRIVKARSSKDAVLALYDNFDHISQPKVMELL